ncbi:RNA-binding protein pno1 [Aphelenchoides avenae]|nr:RNA-binding protein pno1 [Aphelenchus avenae]
MASKQALNVPIEIDDEMPELIDIEDPSVTEALPQLIDAEPTDDDILEDSDVLMKELKPIKEVKRKRKTDEPIEGMEDAFELKKQKAGEVRKVPVPPHRYGPLRENWVKIMTPIVKQLHLQIRFNLKTRNVEIRSPDENASKTNLQKAADFVRAFILGFDVNDAMALIRLDHLFLESFEVTDVKPLKGDHLSRAIGRIAGKDGRTRMTIENVTKTRIVLADSKIHLLGAYQNMRVARHSICSLIMGTPPSKVYGNLRNLSSRLAERL